MGIYLAPSQAGSDSSPGEAPQTQPAQTEQSEGVCLDTTFGERTEEIVPMAVSCGVYEGRPCTGSTRPRCDLAPGEPALCFCVNGTFQCS